MQYLFARRQFSGDLYLLHEAKHVPMSVRLVVSKEDSIYRNILRVVCSDDETVEDAKDFYVSHMDSCNWNNVVDQHNIQTVSFINC